MSNKQNVLQFGDRKWITKKINSVCNKKQKPPRDSNSGCANHSPDTLFTRVWSNLNIAVDKILLLKRKVGSIGGQPFGDCVLFHLTRSEDVLRRRLS